MYKFDKENLMFVKTNVLLKHRAIIFVLLLSFFLVSFITIEKHKEILNKERIIYEKELVIKQKENRIKEIKAPIRKDNYVEDLYKNIGFKLTDKQYKRFSKLALKYKCKLEENHIPATLVWWVAFKESGFDINAKNSTSSAKGMFQFLDGTWNSMCKMKACSKDGRFNEEKQVDIMITYLNYLYGKYGNWEKSMNEYHGGQYQYPVNFLLK